MNEKSYYNIKEASEMLGVTYAHLHHLEKEVPELNIHRTNTGRRLYHIEQLELLKKIIFLTREKGISIKTAGEWVLKSTPEKDILERIGGLHKIKSFLLLLKKKIENNQNG